MRHDHKLNKIDNPVELAEHIVNQMRLVDEADKPATSIAVHISRWLRALSALDVQPVLGEEEEYKRLLICDKARDDFSDLVEIVEVNVAPQNVANLLNVYRLKWLTDSGQASAYPMW